LALSLGQALAAMAADATRPTAAQLVAAAQEHFAKVPDFRPGDLLDRREATALVQEFRARGWQLPKADALVEKVPSADDFMAQVFRTAAGKKFMRQIAAMPRGYDRVDRLARLPHGQQTIRDLIRGPDGYKMIDYMTGSSGGQQLGKMVSNAPKGARFNDPTGRIYTAEAFLDALVRAK
jgi:hypothetical protein